MAKFALSKDTLLKVGIAAAVALIVYLVLRSRSCAAAREGYASFTAPRRRDGYSPYIRRTRPRGRRREGYAMFTAPTATTTDDEYAESLLQSLPAPAEDYAEASGGADAVLGSHLMESTLDDDQANAVFAPDA